jgi:hypothetical protein
MTSGKSGGEINPEKDTYRMCLVICGERRINEEAEPDWFRDHRETVQTAAKTIGLRDEGDVDALKDIVLACDLALEEHIELQPKKICEKLRRLRSHLAKAQGYLLDLQRASRPECLETQYLSTEMESDGTVLEVESDPYEELAASVARFLERSDGVATGRGKRKSVMHFAVAKLEWFIGHHTSDLSVGDQNELIALLLDPIRRRHGHKSRSPVPDPDEVSGYKHLRTKPGKRKQARSSRSPRRII